MCGELFSSNFEVNLNDDPGSFGGATNTRKCTDILGIIIIIIIFGAAIGLTVHCMFNSEPEKLINGYDICGNVCGKDNIKTESMPYVCFGQNYENAKYLSITEISNGKTIRVCLNLCPAKATHYCTGDKSLVPFYAKLREYYWWTILMMCVITIFYGAQTYYFIYCADKFETKLNNRPEAIIVMFILVASPLVVVGFIHLKKTNTKEFLIIGSILAAIAAVVLIITIPSLYGNLKKADIIYQLYQEVNQATNSINLIWILPIISSIIFAAYVYGMTHCLLYVESFSYAEKIDEQLLSNNENDELLVLPMIEYIPYGIATMTQALLIYTIFLLYEFMKNLQTLIISGCVAQSYFAKQNNEESKHTITPLLKHLGTVCCASLILSATFPIRFVVNALKGIVILSYKKCLYSCSRPLLTETLCLTRNGLIMTAIHGFSFCAGTIRARKLLYNNGFNAAAICTFGDYSLLICKLLFWVLSNAFCYVFSNTTSYASFKRELVYLVCCGIVTALLLDYFASAFEITLHTMFLCFCEDCVYNNGASKPYFMSANFARFVENANKYVDEDNWNTVAVSWSGGPGRL